MSRKIKAEMVERLKIPIYLYVSGNGLSDGGRYETQCSHCSYKKFTLDEDELAIRCGECAILFATKVLSEDGPLTKGQPLFIDVPDMGTFRMKCFCKFDEFMFADDHSCFCCADCRTIIAKKEFGGGYGDTDGSWWKI